MTLQIIFSTTDMAVESELCIKIPCDVCSNVTHYRRDRGSVGMTECSSGLTVCSTGCAMRIWNFSRLIDVSYSHEGYVAKNIPCIGKGDKCPCGCEEYYIESFFNNVMNCPEGHRHRGGGGIEKLNNDEISSGKFGKGCTHKCVDCGTGLGKYQIHLLGTDVSAE